MSQKQSLETACFDVCNVRYPLTHVSPAEMDNLLQTEATKGIIGFPIVFDDRKRLFPEPPDWVEVVFK